MTIHIAINHRDESAEYALTEDCVQFFDWDKEKQKATDLPSSLFIAAPELLSVCKVAYEQFIGANTDGTPNERYVLHILKRVIAKAEGKS